MSTKREKIEAGSPTGDVAIIGDESSSGTPVSMQLLQDIYNEFTGKTEEISQGYSKPFQVEITDIEQLNSKISQIQEQYNICSKNCSVTVYYYKDTREVFSSFERFRLYDSSRLSPVESVLLKYDFLIRLPQTNRLQNYTLSVRLASRISIMKEAEEDFPAGFPFKALFTGRTANVSINYIDYLVARNFQDSIKDWIDGLEEHKFPKWLIFLQKRSHYIPRITKYVIGSIILLIILRFLSAFQILDLNQLAKVSVVIFSVFFASFQLAKWFGEYSESSLDRYTELSYIKLNKGDEREITRAKEKNQKNILKTVGGIIGTLVLGILSSIIDKYFLGKLLDIF